MCIAHKQTLYSDLSCTVYDSKQCNYLYVCCTNVTKEIIHVRWTLQCNRQAGIVWLIRTVMMNLTKSNSLALLETYSTLSKHSHDVQYYHSISAAFD